MTSSIAIGVICVIAFTAAGICHTIWLRSRIFLRLALPIDGGRLFRGRHVFGANKTLAGFVVMPPASAVAFAGLGIAAPSVLDAAGWQTDFRSLSRIGFAAGLAYMLGELPNSFIKRRLGIAPGATGRGKVGAAFGVIDQIDSILAALLLIHLLLPFDWLAWATALSLGLMVHIVFNAALVRLGIKSTGYCVRLADAGPECGGKANGLARLIRQGLPVPDGFVILPRAFKESGRIRQDVISELTKILRPLGTEVIVRSSALGEDSANASFAGILSSHRCSNDIEAVLATIETCRQSLNSKHSIEYQRLHGQLDGLGIVVQTYITPMAAGVAFTRSPVAFDLAGDPAEWMLIEAVAGDNAKLVDGSATPARAAFHERHGIRELEGNLPLPTAIFDEVIRLLLVIGDDGPRDVEWVVDLHGEPWIVQSRPITRDSARPMVVWSNANIAENYPSPASTLQYSIVRSGYYHYFRKMALLIGMPRRRVRATDHVLRDVVGLHGARLYFNLSNIYRLCAELPYASAVCTAFDQFMGVSPDVRAKAAVEDRPSDFFSALKIGFLSMFAWWMLPFRVSRFERLVDLYCQQELPEHEVAVWPVREFLNIRFNKWWLISVGDLCTMVDSALVRLLLKRWGQAELEVDLLAGIPNLVSARPGKEIWALTELVRNGLAIDSPEMTARINRYANDYGFRCSEELMLSSPSLMADDVTAMIESYLGAEVEDPARIERRQRQVFERAWKRLSGLGLFRAAVVRYFVRATRKAVSLRERARFQQARLYKRFGAHLVTLGNALTTGRQIQRPDDLLHLDHDELLNLVETRRPVDVAKRRAEFEQEAALQPSEHFVLPQGAKYCAPPKEYLRAGASVNNLVGTPAAGGHTSGSALVTHRIRELNGARSVVVTSQTDPGWAPYMPLIKGLVVERGGLLSHGAIIAREYGIPAVIGVSHATELIANGTDIEVDGDRGLVYTRIIQLDS